LALPDGSVAVTDPGRLDHKPGHGWPAETIARGLQALVIEAGNSRKAAERMKAAGYPVPRETLRGWMTDTHADEYRPARIFYRDRLYEELAEEFQEVERRALESTRKALDKHDELLAAGDIKGATSIANAARNTSTVSGISFDKASLAHGRPTQVTEARDIKEIEAGLRRMGL
jgi:hypothetical protein